MMPDPPFAQPIGMLDSLPSVGRRDRQPLEHRPRPRRELAGAPKWSIIGSGGPLIEHRVTAGDYAVYLALEFHN